MLFLQSLQKQRIFTSTYKRYSVLLNAIEKKKESRSEKVSKKQLVEESDDNNEVISNVGCNNSTDDLSEPDH